MADGGEDLILIGDSFEAILDIFDEDEVLQEQFLTAASEVSAEYLEAYSYLVYTFFFWRGLRSHTLMYFHATNY